MLGGFSSFDGFLRDAQVAGTRGHHGDRAAASRRHRGDLDAQRASVALEQAVRMAPASATARLNLADARRVAGREPEAEQLIRAVLRDEPRNAGALHALGLSLLRQQRPGESLAPLRQASELAPANARCAYVYGLALDRMGRGDQARQVLEAAARRHPRNVELMGALLDLARRARDPEAVTRYTVELRARQASR